MADKSKKVILAFETSCDETCAAVVKTPLKVLSNVISSQVDIHKLYGGVVPEIASRNHAMAVLGVCKEALSRAGVTLNDITHVAAVTEPGLRGAVMVGRVFGEGIAAALDIPFIPVNHLLGHIASVAIDSNIAPPFLALLVSGGHTSLYHVRAWNDIVLLLETVDDAVGECFDKVAKILGLEYPGGVKVEKLARGNTNMELVKFCKTLPKVNGFSYSGLKTAVLNYVKSNPSFDIAHICSSFQHEAIMQLVDRCTEKMRELDISTLCVCGGVSANGYLREKLPNAVFPKMEYCTDNAAMVGAAAILGLTFTPS